MATQGAFAELCVATAILPEKTVKKLASPNFWQIELTNV